MKRTLYIFIVLALAAIGTAIGQTYDVMLTQTVVGTTFTVDVSIGNASAEFVPSTMTLLFNYNTAAIGSPTRVSANDGPWRAANDADYNALLLSTGTGYAGLTVEFAGGDDNNGPSVATAFIRVGTIRFTILNKSLLPALAWRQIGVTTQVFKLATPGTADQTDITTTGDFKTPPDQPLPITLASFVAAPGTSAGSVRLEWSTLSETNNYGFEVERSAVSSGGFLAVPNSFTAGHGTTIDPHTYTFVDRTAASGRWYYRLKQTDLEGDVHYSETVSVEIMAVIEESAPATFELTQNYPNPFNPQTGIRFSVEKAGKATLQVYSMTGQLVATLFDGFAESGQYYRVTFDGARLASGAYVCRLQSGGKSTVRRMLLLR